MTEKSKSVGDQRRDLFFIAAGLLLLFVGTQYIARILVQFFATVSAPYAFSLLPYIILTPIQNYYTGMAFAVVILICLGVTQVIYDSDVIDNKRTMSIGVFLTLLGAFDLFESAQNPITNPNPLTLPVQVLAGVIYIITMIGVCFFFGSLEWW